MIYRLSNSLKILDLTIFARIAFILIVTSDFYLSYRDIGPYPPRNYITAFVTLFALLDLGRMNLKRIFKKYQISILYLATHIIYIGIYYILNGEFILDSYQKNLLKFGTLLVSLQFIIEFLSFPFIKKSIYVICSLSLSVAILQYFLPSIGWSIRSFIDPVTCRSFCNGRPTGLAFYTLSLAEQLLIAIPFVISELFVAKKVKPLTIAICSNILFFSGILIINNRVSTIAYITSLIIISWVKIKGNNKGKAIVCGTILSSTPLISKYFRLLSFEKGNDTSRIEALQGSLYLLSDNIIIGLGPKFKNIISKLNEIKISVPYFNSFQTLGKIAPHNYFINLHFQLGLLGSLLNAFTIYKLFKQNELAKAYLVASIINSFAHNSGFFLSTITTIGLILYTSNSFSRNVKLH